MVSAIVIGLHKWFDIVVGHGENAAPHRTTRLQQEMFSRAVDKSGFALSCVAFCTSHFERVRSVLVLKSLAGQTRNNCLSWTESFSR
jgi:hypothetical protein